MPVTEFGWPLPKRQAYFQDLARDPHAKRYDARLSFRETTEVLPVWRIPIGLPRYRLANGRTASLQEEWIANNPAVSPEFFTADPERDEAQKAQHGLLKKLISGRDLLPFFEDPKNKQADYLILDYLGFVVNGNRRLCAWRELLAKDPGKYAHFSEIDVVVLPKADESAIDKLEGELQLEPHILDEYTWHAFANMMRARMQRHGLDQKTVARFYNKKEPEIRNIIDMRDYAAEYLKARGKEGQWSELDDKEYAFEQMVAKRKQIAGAGEKRLFEVGAFALLDDPGAGRLYQSIPDLHKHRDVVRERLLQEFPIQPPKPDPDDPLGNDVGEIVNQQLAALIDDCPANRKKAAAVIKDVVETQNLLERERDSTQYVLKQLQRANAAVQSALTATHRPDMSREGVEDAIQSIEGGLHNLRTTWLKRDV